MNKTDDGAPDVCFVSMPYVEIQRPSLALSLLQGILERDGVRAKVVHASMWFAEKVGSQLYEATLTTPPNFLAGEWTFAAAAFGPRPEQEEQEYLRLFAEALTDPFVGGGDPVARVAMLRRLRVAAVEFVDETARRVLATGARVVGCTSTFEQHTASLALLRRIHELDPEVITMMGGANCETAMGEATHRLFPWVDYVVSGEADGIVSDLCRRVLKQGREIETADLPAGVLGPRHRRQLTLLGGKRVPRALFNNLDSLPAPTYADYFETLERSPLRDQIVPGLPLETSRGCWWGAKHQCTFCGLNGSSLGYRSKSAERVREEIETLWDRHGISGFEVVDNILDMRYFQTLLPQLAEENKPWRFFYEVKANLSHEQLELLVRSGIVWVQPGIESLHSEVLQLMDKGVAGWQNIQLLKWSKELGMRLSWSLLWGFPGEKDDYYLEMAEWLPLLEHLQAPFGLNPLAYHRYSVYHAQAQELGLTLFPVTAMAYVYPVPERDLHELAYFFTLDPSGTRLDPMGRNPDGSLNPGVEATLAAVKHWTSAAHSRRPPTLFMADEEGELDVVDTRECAVKGFWSLTGLDRAVLLACDGSPRPERVGAVVERDYGITATAEQITETVRRLVEAKLILPIDDRLVGLAVNGAGERTPAEFPGGRIRQSMLRNS
ncbi:RiPP maturation radical SAM C-methyltransferase [Actinospica durhamensis]|uniref:RiPP maturation radical SAM C-methyltransferase n=1 Tax=Actinospica durhamensis TaxID=1508375 RepID=A0A941EMA5_9ACTN|nr:RiPP maturation radical SAM C-methyltransferase [Actinospica durhamensis]MBR7834302.1 RiPP maturation radical SAM C-methyltransferase [Actinospica durhamensis]